MSSRTPAGRLLPLAVFLIALAAPGAPAQGPKLEYAFKKTGRTDTVLATLKANGLPNLEGTWFAVGPFDNTDNAGYSAAYGPEKTTDRTKAWPGKGGKDVTWKEFAFAPGQIVNLARFMGNDNVVTYLLHEFETPKAADLPLSIGSDDSITLWLDGKQVFTEDVVRPCAPDQSHTVLKLTPGKHQLLVKMCNLGGGYEVYLLPEFPADWSADVRKQLDRDFPQGPAGKPGDAPTVNAENRYYRMSTVNLPPDVSLEAGGLAFRPDGKLMACTRRGEVWTIDKPEAEDARFTRFASGLHESLGLIVEDNGKVLVTQRGEITRLTDRDGDGKADDFVTLTDEWGISGNYHEYAFGPARDKDGNLFVTLNVGFGGNHQSMSPWRGWCLKISPDGKKVEPWALGLRSPNGVNFSPDGELFYADNQGEWAASNKLHHIRKGEFYGHNASLRWLKYSPFAEGLPEELRGGTVKGGQLYDGQPAKDGLPAAMPPVTPPCVWFPYGRMGQSLSEPIWDTTAGKFGPFAGQIFVGDQSKSVVMRTVLEKVNGRYQGACFPFRSGFQCGVNRLVFGPDGTLYAGQTGRGWGSLGPKPYGLQRLTYTGELPFEMYSISLTKDGFDVTFTKPLAGPNDPKAKALTAESAGVVSFTYLYDGHYGSPEIDRKAEKVAGVALSEDRKKLSITLGSPVRRGRVYEVRLSAATAESGETLLHPEGYYTVNELR